MDDWRTTLQSDDRQRIVNNIMETLKRDRKSSGPDELSKIATTFEETMYMASTSQSDYLRKVSTIQSTSAGSTENPSDLASIDSTAQTGHNAVDWQEECYQKIKSMKELYLSDLSVMYQKISIKCEQHDSILNVPNSEQIERLKLFKNMLDRTIHFLNVPKNNIVPAVKEKLPAYEKQIIGILNSNKPRKPVSAQQELLSAQIIQSISNTNMFKLQYLEPPKKQLEQQFREWQMYQQWLNQQMQHVLQQQQHSANTSGATAAVGTPTTICSIAGSKPNVTASSYTTP